jgi:tRNA(Ile)-lysidine synthase TilS/MesJ
MEKHIEKSIEILKMFEPKEDFYHLAFSGGKDSCVLIQLAKMANVKLKLITMLRRLTRLI